MKYALVLSLLFTFGATCAMAQENLTAEASAASAAPIRISDSEAVIIMQTIKGYAESARGTKYLQTFDRKKGEKVSLRLDRIVTDDPSRIVFPEEGVVAVCGECTQVFPEKVTEKDALPPEGDKYEMWFVVKRGTLPMTRVLDVIVKSVNGKPMYKWEKDASGKWQATLVPDTAE